MRHNIHPARLTRYLPAFALLLGVVLVAGCTGGSGSSAAAKTSGSATPALTSADDCLFPPASCYTPDQYRAAYGIQPLLNTGIDGRGETVTDLETAVFNGQAGPPPSSHALASPAPSNSFTVTGPQGAPGISVSGQIRQHIQAARRADRGGEQPRPLTYALAGVGWRAGGWRGGRGP
jgi:hypothetical protein